MDDQYIFVEHDKPFRYEDGETIVTRGSAWSAPGCHLGCGVLIRTDKQGNLIDVEGDPDNPFNQGRLCVRCIATKEGGFIMSNLNIAWITKLFSAMLFTLKRRHNIANQVIIETFNLTRLAVNNYKCVSI